MRDPGSRYHNLPEGTLTLEDGRSVTFYRRRFLPRAADMALQQEVVLAQGDRLDLLAGRLLGDGTASWRLADANDAMYPPELEGEPGTLLRIAIPQV